MRTISAAVALLWIGASASAQNLQNESFERPWNGTGPPDWSVAWASGGSPSPQFAFRETTLGLVHCGVASCRIDTTGLTHGLYHFAKQWNNVAMGTVLEAKVRFLAPSVPAGGIKIMAVETEVPLDSQGVPISYNRINATLDSHTVVASEYWQEVTVRCVTSLDPSTQNGHLRFMLEMNNADDVVMYIDNVDFSLSDTDELNGGDLEDPSCWEVKGAEISTIVDLQTGFLREIRKLDATGTSFGENLLIDGGSPIASVTYSNADFSSPLKRSLADSNAAHDDPVWRVPVGSAPAPGSSHSIVLEAVRGVALTPPGFIPDEMGLTVAVVLPTNSTGIGFAHFIEAGEGTETKLIEGITTPRLLMRANPAGGDDWLFTPRDVGQVVRLDSSVIAPDESEIGPSTFEYPGSASMQIASTFDDVTGGLTVRAEDMHAQTKKLNYHVQFEGADASVVRLEWEHMLSSLRASEQSFTPYLTIVEPSGTSWMSSMESYRDAMATAPWVTNSRRSANDISPWVLERPTLIEAGLRPAGVGVDLVPIQDWACVLDTWGQYLSLDSSISPMLPLFRDFENLGTYSSPNYLPLQVLNTDSDPDPMKVAHNESKIEGAWDAVEASGHIGLAMLAGMKFAVLRSGDPVPCVNDPVDGKWGYWVMDLQPTQQTATYWPPDPAYLAHGRDGILIDVPPGAEWDSKHHIIDPYSQFGINLHREMAEELAESGRIDLYLFDQLTGTLDNFAPPVDPSGNPLHAPGSGSWKANALINLFANTLDAGRSASAGNNPNFEVTVEHLCEIYLLSAAIQGGRVDRTRGFLWRALDDQVLPVPAFQYAYGHVTSFMGWDMRLESVDAHTFNFPGAQDGYEARRKLGMEGMGRSLAAGSFASIGYAPWQLIRRINPTFGCGPIDPRQVCPMDPGLPVPANLDAGMVEFAQNVVRTEQGPSRDFLNFGRMVSTEGFAFDPALGIEYSENDWWGRSTTTGEVVSPPVLISARELAPDHFGILLANIDSKPHVSHSVTLPTTLGGVTIPATAKAYIHEGGVEVNSGDYSNFSSIAVVAEGVTFIEIKL